jgi:HK97 family phage prohead protease
MTILRRTVPAEFTVLGDREVEVRMSTSARARDGHILEPDGCLLDNYRTNPIVLWDHDSGEPIGTNDNITVQPDCLTARTTFAPAGISQVADKICGLVKAGVIRAGSIGFNILAGDPIDPARPRAGLRVTSWELWEFSFVAVPADTGAIVTARNAAGGPDNQQEDAGMAADPNRTARLVLARSALLTPAAAAPKLRGLYDVAQLAYLLQQLGYAKDSADWEKNLEGDDSVVPAMLGDALIQLGNSLIAMAQEEVGELLADTLTQKAIDDQKGEQIAVVDRAYVAAAPTDRARAWRFAQARVRAGKAISAANAAKLSDACTHMERAAKGCTDAAGNLETASGHQEAIGDAHARAQTAHDKMATAIEAANGSAPADVAAQIAKVQQHHNALGKHLATIGDRCAAIGDVQADAGGAIAGAKRCMRSAVRCMRSVTDADGDTDSTDIQTSDGDGDSEGSANDRAFAVDFRRRQAALMELSAA